MKFTDDVLRGRAGRQDNTFSAAVYLLMSHFFVIDRSAKPRSKLFILDMGEREMKNLLNYS